MAIIQNTVETLSFDLAQISGATGLELKIYSMDTKETKKKWKFPNTTGWEQFTVDGTVYSAKLTQSITDALSSGIYGIELGWYIGSDRFAIQAIYDSIITKAT